MCTIVVAESEFSLKRFRILKSREVQNILYMHKKLFLPYNFFLSKGSPIDYVAHTTGRK